MSFLSKINFLLFQLTPSKFGFHDQSGFEQEFSTDYDFFTFSLNQSPTCALFFMIKVLRKSLNDTGLDWIGIN